MHFSSAFLLMKAVILPPSLQQQTVYYTYMFGKIYIPNSSVSVHIDYLYFNSLGKMSQKISKGCV
jgi:hypothetical protein